MAFFQFFPGQGRAIVQLPLQTLAFMEPGESESSYFLTRDGVVQEKIAVYAPNLRGQGLDPVVKRRGSDLNIRQLLSDIRAMV